MPKEDEVTYNIVVQRITNGVLEEIKVEGYPELMEAWVDIDQKVSDKDWQA